MYFQTKEVECCLSNVSVVMAQYNRCNIDGQLNSLLYIRINCHHIAIKSHHTLSYPKTLFMPHY